MSSEDRVIRTMLAEHTKALEEEVRYALRNGGMIGLARSNATGEAIIEYVRKKINAHDILDAFYQLTVKERDLARFQLARLRSGIVDSVVGKPAGETQDREQGREGNAKPTAE